MNLAQTKRSLHRARHQGGFTLVELAIVVVILGILGFLFIVDTDPDKARATKVIQAITTHAGAATIYRAEMGCYPAKLAYLTAKQPNGDSNTTLCGTDMTSKWTSPYIQSAAFDSSGALSLDSTIPGATAQIVTGTAVAGVSPIFYRITPMSKSLAARVVEICNGNIGTGSCTETFVAGSTTQKYIDYRFGQI